MKDKIHPKYNPKAKVSCACGHTFTTGSIQTELKTELCSVCHPFYTGKQKLVDTARRVEKFKARIEAGKEASITRKGKKIKQATRVKANPKKEIVIKVGSGVKKNAKTKKSASEVARRTQAVRNKK